MDTTLPRDFREFLQSLNANDVEYLVIGGYAVGYHGYVRATVDMDVWIGPGEENAARAVAALREFGLDDPELSPDLFHDPATVLRYGVPPLRLELMTAIDGVSFEECYAVRVVAEVDGIEVPVIDLEHLKKNKLACGRHKDLADLENLP